VQTTSREPSAQERSSALAAAAWSAGIRAGRGVDGESRNESIAAARREVLPPLAEGDLLFYFLDPAEQEGEPRVLVAPRLSHAMLGEEVPSLSEPAEAPVVPAPPLVRVATPS
jgi:hypothetical protein